MRLCASVEQRELRLLRPRRGGDGGVRERSRGDQPPRYSRPQERQPRGERRRAVGPATRAIAVASSATGRSVRCLEHVAGKDVRDVAPPPRRRTTITGVPAREIRRRTAVSAADGSPSTSRIATAARERVAVDARRRPDHRRRQALRQAPLRRGPTRRSARATPRAARASRTSPTTWPIPMPNGTSAPSARPRAWIACSTPIASRFATIDEPPTVTNGSGMPVTGAMPIVMPDVDEHLEEEGEDDPAGDDRAVEVSGDRDDAQAAPHDEQVEQQQDRGADEPALLRERREDEVGGVLRKVVEARLARALDAAAREAAGADRRSRLGHVVRQPARIAVGVREARQAGGLVRLQHLDARRRQKPEHARSRARRRRRRATTGAASAPRRGRARRSERRRRRGPCRDRAAGRRAPSARGRGRSRSRRCRARRRGGRARRGSRRSPARRTACRTRTAGTGTARGRSSASSRAPPRRRRRRRSSPRSCRRRGTASGAGRRTAG